MGHSGIDTRTELFFSVTETTPSNACLRKTWNTMQTTVPLPSVCCHSDAAPALLAGCIPRASSCVSTWSHTRQNNGLATSCAISQARSGNSTASRSPGANAAETTNNAGIRIFFIALPSLTYELVAAKRPKRPPQLLPLPKFLPQFPRASNSFTRPKVFQLEKLPQLDLAVLVRTVRRRSSLGPLDRFFPRLHLNDPVPRDQFLRLRERTVDDGTFPARKLDARALRTGF